MFANFTRFISYLSSLLYNKFFFEAKQFNTLRLLVPLSTPSPRLQTLQNLSDSCGLSILNTQNTQNTQNGASLQVPLPRINATKTIAIKFLSIILFLCTTNNSLAQDEIPIAAYDYQIISLCDTIIIQFYDKTNSNPTDWLWNFPEGKPASSREQNPLISFPEFDAYTVSLVVTNARATDVLYDVNAVNIDENTLPFNVPKEIFKCADIPLELAIEPYDSFKFEWSPNIDISDTAILNPVFSNAQTSIYTLSIFDEVFGCTKTSQIAVKVHPTINLTMGEAREVCKGDSVQLSANTDTEIVTIEWFQADSLENSNTLNPIAYPFNDITYALNVEDEHGCTASATQSVTVNTSGLNVFAGEDVTICSGDSIPLNAIGGSFFSWSPANSLNDSTLQQVMAAPTSTTNYILNASTEYCTGADTVLVTVLESPVSTYLKEYTVCIGDSIELNNALSDESYTYSWTPDTTISNPNASNPIVFPKETIEYFVLINQGSQCADTIYTTVNVVEELTLQSTMDTIVCPGDTVSLFVSGGKEYNWSPDVYLSNPNDSITLSYPAETITYTVTSGVGSCAAKKDITVGVYPAPEIDAGADIYVCLGDETQLNASGAFEYEWKPETGLSNAGIANPFFGDTISTNYVVTGKNGIGCAVTDTIFVEVKDLPVVEISPTVPTICRESSVQLTVSGAVSYQWLPKATLSQDTGNQVIASPMEETTYTIAGTDIFGCRSSIFITVEIVDSLNLKTIADTIRGCINTPILLAASGGETYFWSPSDYLNTTVGDSVYGNFPGIDTLHYTVTGTDFTDCSASRAVVVITAKRETEVSTSENSSVCLGDSTLIAINGLASQQWTPADKLADSTSAAIYVAPTETQIYSVTGKDVGGCLYNEAIRVKVNPLPFTALNNETIEKCKGSDISVKASGGSVYLWSPEIGLTESERIKPNPTITVNETVTYSVNITDTNNCTSIDSVTIEVKDCMIEFATLIPNSFTPNNDGRNDVWQLANTVFQDYRNQEVYVFNRWGHQIFDAEGDNWQWNGMFNEKNLPEATYYYKLVLSEELPAISGTITLIR